MAENCVRCHGGAKTKAGLDLRTAESVLKGSENGPVVEPGDWNLALFDAASRRRTHFENTGMRTSKALFDPSGQHVFVAGGTGQKRDENGTFPDWGRIDIFRLHRT